MKSWPWAVSVIGLAVLLVGGTMLLRDQVPGGDRRARGTSGGDATGSGSNDTAIHQGGPSEPDQRDSADDRIAAPGEPLSQVTEPPSRTIALIDPDRVPHGTVFDVRFRPFGVGPWGDDSVVVRIVSVGVADREGVDVSGLEGSNAIVRLESEAAEVVTEGGEYAGTIRAVQDRDVVILSVMEAERLAE